MEIDNRGIAISFGQTHAERTLVASTSADQTNPAGHYVYAHTDPSGDIFYIGKGKGRRAWSSDRHLVWKHYVDRHLDGDFQVVILADGLSSREAEDLESRWIAQESDGLVNWVNFSRETDYAATESYWEGRKESRALAAEAKALEKSDLASAVALYRTALERIDSYARIQPETGFLGRLMDEITEERGYSGDIRILDRLSLCLVRAGRPVEAREIVRDYFQKYRMDRELKAADRIWARVEKGIQREGGD